MHTLGPRYVVRPEHVSAISTPKKTPGTAFEAEFTVYLIGGQELKVGASMVECEKLHAALIKNVDALR